MSSQITFAGQLASKSDALARFVRHDRLVGFCRDLVGPDARLYHDQAVYKKPEKPRRFPWHQDNGYLFIEPQQYLTCWIALTDATVDNGCPQVVPRLPHLTGPNTSGVALHDHPFTGARFHLDHRGQSQLPRVVGDDGDRTNQIRGGSKHIVPPFYVRCSSLARRGPVGAGSNSG